MEKKITKQSVETTMEVTTENAMYVVNYTVIDKKLVTVKTDIIVTRLTQVPDADGNPTMQDTPENIGTLRMEYDVMRNDNLLYSEDLPKYMADFCEIVKSIVAPEAEVAEETE